MGEEVKSYVVSVAAGVLLAVSGMSVPAGSGVGGDRRGVLDWDFAAAAASKARVIEVVDAIPGNRWKVAKAVRWLDAYTASRARVVKKCTGTAFRCIRVQEGPVSGPIGRSRGTVVTIDTERAESRAFKRWYGEDRHRTWLLVHELGHQFGLGHSTGGNVMNPAVNRYRMKLTSRQRAHLRRS